MNNPTLDLGLALAVKAESFGEPGHRTFRILVETGAGKVSVWLEKEQVAALGSAIDELLERVSGGASEDRQDAAPTFTGELEVKAGSLSVGYDQRLGSFLIEAGDFTSPFDISSISFRGTREQFEEVRDQIDEIVAASRPRCPLCGRPLTGGSHFCPESNGHAHLAATD